VPTDGVDFDTGTLSDSGTADSPLHAATAGAAAYVPPSANAQTAAASSTTSTSDVEQGQATTTAPNTTSTTISEAAQSQPSQSPPVDLLDVEQGKPAENKDSAMQSSLHELD